MILLSICADCANRACLQRKPEGRQLQFASLPGACNWQNTTKYPTQTHTHTYTLYCYTYVYVCAHTHIFIYFFIIVIAEVNAIQFEQQLLDLTWVGFAFGCASPFPFRFSCSRMCVCVFERGIVGVGVRVCIQIIVKGTACPWALPPGHVFGVEMGNHFFLHAADFLLWFRFEIYIMWHSLDAATSFCQHTHQEWRHTRAERSTRYRKCALLPIHDSQLTIHNLQFV